MGRMDNSGDPAMPGRPKLIIHGGAGNVSFSDDRITSIRVSLRMIIRQTYEVLLNSNSRTAVLYGIRMLEDDPLFNAGTGSKLQKDGVARMSASVMDSTHQHFSAVINVENIQHPIDLADRLSSEKYRILAGEHATHYARQNGFSYYDPVTPERRKEYEQKIKDETGTVGIVAIDADGTLCAGTSTGGVGMEIEGRVSDSPTVAGNYVSDAAGVTVTGVGEDIVNLSVASRIVAFIETGMPLPRAIARTLSLGESQNAQFGIIAIDSAGIIGYGKTTSHLFFAVHDCEKISTFA